MESMIHDPPTPSLLLGLAQSLQDVLHEIRVCYHVFDNPIASCHYYVSMPSNTHLLEESPGSADACIVVRIWRRSLNHACMKIAQSDFFCRRRVISHSYGKDIPGGGFMVLPGTNLGTSGGSGKGLNAKTLGQEKCIPVFKDTPSLARLTTLHVLFTTDTSYHHYYDPFLK